MITTIQLGDFVRFRSGMAPETLKGRERELGTVTALVAHQTGEQWPVVQFEGYRTAALSPNFLEVVGEAWPAEDDAAGASRA